MEAKFFEVIEMQQVVSDVSDAASNFGVNNRLIAIWFWLAVGLLGLSFAKSDVRRSIGGVMLAFASWKLLLPIALVFGYILLLCVIALHLGIMTETQYGPAVLWMLSGVGLLMGAVGAEEKDDFFKGLIVSALSVTALMEFVSVLAPFHLAIEIVLAPFVLLLVLMKSVSGRDPRHEPADRVLDWLLTIVGILYLGRALLLVFNEPSAFFTVDTMRAFAFPIWATVGTIPVIYAFFCYTHIKKARRRIDIKTYQPPEVRLRAKRRFTLVFLLRPWLMNRAVDKFWVRQADGPSIVDDIIREVLEEERQFG